MQMTDGPATPAATCCRLFTTALSFLIFGPISVVLALVSIILCPCLCIPMMRSHEDGACNFFSFVTMAWMMLLITVVVVRSTLAYLAYCPYVIHQPILQSLLVLPLGIAAAAIFIAGGIVCCPCICASWCLKRG